MKWAFDAFSQAVGVLCMVVVLGELVGWWNWL
jgi:hypothetical protein